MSESSAPDRLEAARLEKLKRIVELGHDPYGQRFDDHLSIREARAKAPAENGVDGETVRVAGLHASAPSSLLQRKAETKR